MRFAIRASGVGLAAALVALGSGACVDLSPLDYSVPEAGVSDAAPLDAAGADGRVLACDTCFAAQPTCSMNWRSCQADAKCSMFADCKIGRASCRERVLTGV